MSIMGGYGNSQTNLEGGWLWWVEVEMYSRSDNGILQFKVVFDDGSAHYKAYVLTVI